VSWRRFFRRAQTDAELRQELDSYLEITAAEYVARGMGEDEARRAARRKLGNLTRIREEVHDVNTAAFVEGAVRDLRHAVRMLRLNPAFSLAAVLTLALGIGATTAIFSVVHGVVIKPLPYPDSERVVTVTHTAVFGNERGGFPFSPQFLATYGAGNQSFEELGIWTGGPVAITGVGDPEEVTALLVSQATLPVLGVRPALGRGFSPADDRPGAPETVIVSDGYWQRRLGADPGAIGSVMTIDARPREIIGVMPPRFTIAGVSADLILPLQIDMAQPPPDFGYQGLARLRDGVTLEQANADIGRLLPVWMDTYVPADARAGAEALQLQPDVHPFKEDVVGDVGQALWVMLGSISVLLLVACANVANLLLVRAEGRSQELAVRSALGARWGHLARALMVESVTLGLLGGLLGVGLAYGILQIVVAVGPDDGPRLGEIASDRGVLAFAAATSIASGVIFGLAPIAKHVGRKATSKVPEFVSGGARWASAGRRRHRSQNALVVAQVALALVLLVGSGLMIRTFQKMLHVEPGFTSPETIQTVRVSLPGAMRAEPDRVVQTQAQILERLAAIPGVEAAAYIEPLPMEGGISAIVAPEDTVYEDGELPPTRRIKPISPGLFATLGTPLLAGRDFDWAEVYNQRNVAIVSEGFARESWNSVEGALGKRVKLGTDGPWQEVVGVVADVYDDGADREAPPTVYWPMREHPFVAGNLLMTSVSFAIRSDRADTAGFVSEIRQAVAGVTPDRPVAQVRTLDDVYRGSMARKSFFLTILGIAGAMALVLSIVGIYGVLAYAVAQHRREVGIRLALGARPGTVTGMFVSRGMRLSGVGIALGVVAAVGVTRLMSSLLFGVTPLDAGAFLAAVAVLVVAALAASYIPARRAAGVDPVQTLGGQ
jgi:predicted permease